MITSAPWMILLSLLVSLVAVSACWIYGLRHGNDLSLIDAYYGAGSLVHGGLTFALWHQRTARGAVLAIVAGLWSLGLAQSMGRRWWKVRKSGGDQRYRDVSEQLHLTGRGFWWKSYFTIVAPQACLILLLNLPLQTAIMTRASGFSVTDVIAILIVAGAGTMEVVANWQLEVFKRSPHRGSTLMTGVWAWSRHPNYFGNTMVYVGFYLAALRDGSLWWTVVSPLAALFILRFILGVPMTDENMLKKRAHDAAYLAYVQRTPSFLPRRPRSVGRDSVSV